MIHLVVIVGRRLHVHVCVAVAAIGGAVSVIAVLAVGPEIHGLFDGHDHLDVFPVSVPVLVVSMAIW